MTAGFSGNKGFNRGGPFSGGGRMSRTFDSGYNPLTAIPGLHGYFDAMQAGSITQAGSLVSEWRCLKTGYAVQQASDPAKPIYSATSFGGDPGLTFDGIDDVLAAVSHPYPLVGYEIWLLLSQPSLVADTAQKYALGMGTGSPQGATVSRVVVSGANRARGTLGNGTSAVNSTNLSVDFSSRHVVRAMVRSTGIITEVDGVTFTEALTTPALSNARFRFGAFINTLAGNFYQGQIAACLITPSLSGATLSALQTWLLARRKL